MLYAKKTTNKKQASNKQYTNRFHSILEEVPFGYVEAYKTLRTNLEFIASVNDTKCIMVTSAIPEESKSTTAVNLAIALANNGRSVALVECDLRKPILRKYLKMERRVDGSEIKGLSSLLAGEATLGECLYRVKKYDISVIVAGKLPPNPSELLNHNRMGVLLNALKERFDFVILDAPPVTVVTDAAVVGRFADGALLVMRSKYAPTKMIQLAKQRLEDVNIKILGSVITRYDIKKSGWHSGYDYAGYEYGYGQNRSNK